MSTKAVLWRLGIGLIIGMVMGRLGGESLGMEIGAATLVGGAFLALIFKRTRGRETSQYFFAKILLISISIMLGSETHGFLQIFKK